jgi:poly(3-hydroxybutyrate) depolymerase
MLLLGVAVAVAPAVAAAGAAAAAGAGSAAAAEPAFRPPVEFWPAPTPPVPTSDMPFRLIGLTSGRSYVLHPPPTASATGRPLVLLLPGLYNTWTTLESQGDWSRYADAHGFVAAYGVGIQNSWDAGSCCGPAAQQGVDDVAYLATVLADVARRVPIDRTRVYLVGFSNGEMMALRGQCDRPDLFAASGGAGGQLVAGCHSPDRQIRERHLHGTADLIVPYNGGYSAYTGTTFPSVAELPALIAADSPDPAVSITSLPCGHAWPRLDNACGADATNLIWQWVSGYTRAPAAVAAARTTGRPARRHPVPGLPATRSRAAGHA